jgi:1,4-dihydroxy-2-naphthoyl-CoA hydrolase
MTEDLTTTKGFNTAAKFHFSGHLNMSVTNVSHGIAKAEMCLGPQHLTPTGFIHGAAVIGIADTVCRAGCQGSKPDGAIGFTTIELK